MAQNFEKPDKVEIKQFTTNCLNMSGGASPTTLYLGYPMRGSHPLAFQDRFLRDRGISIPTNVMESFEKLSAISLKTNISFIELCDYVIKEVELGKSLQEDSQKANEISRNTEDKELQSTQLIDNSQISSSENNSENEQLSTNPNKESSLDLQRRDESHKNLSSESSQPNHPENQQNQQKVVDKDYLETKNDLKSSENKISNEEKSLFDRISNK